MMCVVRAMTSAVSTPLPIGSIRSTYDTGAFIPGTRRAHGHPPLA